MPTNTGRTTKPEETVSDDKEATTVAVPQDVFEAMQKQLAELQARAENADAAQAAAVKAAKGPVNVIDIEPENKDVEPEDTYIVYREYYTENGVQKTRDFRMKTADFPQICAERGW